MLLLALMLRQDPSEEREGKRGNGPKRCRGTAPGSAPRGRWCLPSSQASPRSGVNSEDICKLRRQVPSCSGRPGTLTGLLPTAKNVFQCNYRR